MSRKSRQINCIIPFLCLLILTIAPIGSFAKPIDIILLIDSSGSMAWRDRDPGGIRKEGAKLFLDLCEKEDRIGIIDFSADTNIIFPLYEIFTTQDKITLKEKVDKVSATGEFTDIVLALQASLKEMSRARGDSIKAVFLLTDGEIDPDPSREIFSPHNKDYLQEIKEASGNTSKINEIKEKYKDIVAGISREILRKEVLPQYKENNILIFSVAFGSGADIIVLREIADLTITDEVIRNYYFIGKASNLQPVFSEILEQIKKTREKISEETVNFTGEEIIHKIYIDDFIKELHFKFIFERKTIPSEIQISLKEPDGNIIDRKTQKGGVSNIFEEGYELYNITNPLPGTWEAIITGEKNVKLDITISTWGRTDLKIMLAEEQSEYHEGDSIPIAASLEREGARITSHDFLKNLKFFAIAENPYGDLRKFELKDDGSHPDKIKEDGVYSNLYTDTSLIGDYIIKVHAQGITTETKNFNFTREAEYRIRVLPKKEVPTVYPQAIQEEDKSKLKIDWITPIKSMFPYILGIVSVIFIITLFSKTFKKSSSPKNEISREIGREDLISTGEIETSEEESFSLDEEPPLPPESIVQVPLVTLRIKDGGTVIVGSKQLKHSSVGRKNLIIDRMEEEYFIHSEEGTLELNNSHVNEMVEIKNGDVLKIGDLYFEVELQPEKNRANLLGITQEEALSRF